jgi:hypothetical protein
MKVIMETSHGTFAGYLLSNGTIAIFENADPMYVGIITIDSRIASVLTSPDGTVAEAMKEWLDIEYNSKVQIRRILSSYVDKLTALDERQIYEDFPLLALSQQGGQDPSETRHPGRDESPETSTASSGVAKPEQNYPETSGEGTLQKVSRKWWHWH